MRSQLLAAVLFAPALFAQYAPSAAGSSTAAAEINSKSVLQVLPGPPSGSCTHAKDLYLDAAALDLYGCVSSAWQRSGASAAGYYFVSRSANAPANAVNLGGLSTGLLKLTVAGGVATPSAAIAGTDFQAPITAGSNTQYFRGDFTLATLGALALVGYPSAGIVKSTGSGLLPAIAGTDYQAPITTGSNTQYLRGDLSLATLGALALAGYPSAGIVKSTGSGLLPAVAGTDYQAPITTGSNTQYLRGDLTLATFPSVGAHTISIPISGTPIATGTASVGLPGLANFSCTINKAQIVANASGSITVDIWKAAGAIPTSANKISATAPVSLSSAQISTNAALTGWSLTVTSGDVFWASVATADGVLNSATVTLTCQ